MTRENRLAIIGASMKSRELLTPNSTHYIRDSHVNERSHGAFIRGEQDAKMHSCLPIQARLKDKDMSSRRELGPLM